MLRFFLLCGILCSLISNAVAQDRWPQIRSIAFVDVQRVILEYKKTQEITDRLEKKLQADSEGLRARKAAHESKVLALRKEEAVDTLNQEAVLERVRREKELALERVDLEIELAVMQAQLEQRLAEHLRKVYDELIAECTALRQELGIDVIFLSRRLELGAGQTKQAVMANILTLPVLSHSTELDLTNRLLARLNAK